MIANFLTRLIVFVLVTIAATVGTMLLYPLISVPLHVLIDLGAMPSGAIVLLKPVHVLLRIAPLLVGAYVAFFRMGSDDAEGSTVSPQNGSEEPPDDAT